VTTAQQDAERAGELAALREAVRDLIEGSGGIAAARRRLDDGPADPGYDEDAWRLLGTEMGLAGLGIAEDLGGAGGGLAELTVVAEELGRSLLPVPFFSSTVLAGQILARCPDSGSDVLARLSLIGRFGQPAEIASAVLWLCSDESTYTMGHVLAVDGGYLAR